MVKQPAERTGLLICGSAIEEWRSICGSRPIPFPDLSYRSTTCNAHLSSCLVRLISFRATPFAEAYFYLCAQLDLKALRIPATYHWNNSDIFIFRERSQRQVKRGGCTPPIADKLLAYLTITLYPRDTFSVL